ncbi:hypothetical protein B0T17DRAFT_213823 [Bombardia bombarda]|uniref:Uncharacterized protein n=1 Tax=Bombardia bombarda TaxID=252184 RepID=A0AA39XA56_9PEZI|nr:hypothetical protein B0T17DRAFT_213823 [Bombardia bombarda]
MMLANHPAPQMAAQTTMEMDGIGAIGHQRHHHNLVAAMQLQQPQSQPQSMRRKRKAYTQPENNERLSKRMSFLNLEEGGTKLYVPVENPQVQLSASNPAAHIPNSTISLSSSSSSSSLRSSQLAGGAGQDDSMQLDDSKYKIYIYNLDDELSSESEPEDGRLVFLPDIEKHMRTNGILPSYVLDGSSGIQPSPAELASKQLVLYSVPSSITVPEEQDSVRKAIIEARARAREKQRAELKKDGFPFQLSSCGLPPPHSNSTDDQMNGLQSALVAGGDDDPDAMELD